MDSWAQEKVVISTTIEVKVLDWMGRLAISIVFPLRVHSEIVVWIYDTFDNNFEIKNDFTKYLKESCWLCPY